MKRSQNSPTKSDLTIRLNSFGYQKSGIPADTTGNNGGFVFDCRFLPNPGREERYRSQNGRDIAVIQYLEKYPEVEQYLNNVIEIIDLAIESYIERDYTSLMISFGCTGGQHRSVYCAEQIMKHLKKRNVSIELNHVELGISESYDSPRES
ncbi:MAG: RNase adapter RapZ [candidate division KSB1 bacterium]|jgi:RNase adaptor protein for sRNA GlmZ degradation|nr:RNase adapter RapZ [candidate division KSB1 bacterium]